MTTDLSHNVNENGKITSRPMLHPSTKFHNNKFFFNPANEQTALKT